MVSIIVEHEERRKKILQEAMSVFAEEGFESTTFQKIADRCGITRTTLYLYFRNKHEIFSFSIKEISIETEALLIKIQKDTTIPACEKLKRLIKITLTAIHENRLLLSVTLNYLLNVSKSPELPNQRVKQRTIRLKHIMSNIIIEGIEKGEIKKINIRKINELLYSLVEAAIFRLIILGRESFDEIYESAVDILSSIEV